MLKLKGHYPRRYGPQSLLELLVDLKFVFISHIHADHHLGLVRMLLKRDQILSERGMLDKIPNVIVAAPASVHNWLAEFSTIQKLRFTFVNNYNFLSPPTTIATMETEIGIVQNYSEDTIRQVLMSLGLNIQTVLVDHCPDAYGIVLTHVDGWKLVFSGDTRPCKALAQAGYGAHLVIHEATFEDDKKEDAQQKAHATTSEAIDTATEMNSRFTILNHFSQRYPKIPNFPSTSAINSTAVAFDLMSVRMTEFYFSLLPSLYPALKAICTEVEKVEEKEEEEEEEEEDTIETLVSVAGKQEKTGRNSERGGGGNKNPSPYTTWTSVRVCKTTCWTGKT
eukprot:TRINITY_DN1065_c0_g3_i5.p1 TRINITY_DN1065_c0_g3~~TRINITY_DN1065_c0_g3_i5.p1  ORF type:complete len:337 (-),score=93.02 TRINITY_DN1065_c0_g3_i5:28-1038(-)